MHQRVLQIGSINGNVHLSIGITFPKGLRVFEGCINGQVFVTAPTREAAASSLLRRVLVRNTLL